MEHLAEKAPTASLDVETKSNRLRLVVAIALALLVLVAGTGFALAAGDEQPPPSTSTSTGSSKAAKAAKARAVQTEKAQASAAAKAEADAQLLRYYAWAIQYDYSRWMEQAVAYEAAKVRAAQARARRSAPSGSGSTVSGGVLDCIRHRESRGNYGVYNSQGSGAAGAYQFMQGTWDSTARHAGRHDLVGVSPANASPADQDAMAAHLLSWQGLGPWGGACG